MGDQSVVGCFFCQAGHAREPRLNLVMDLLTRMTYLPLNMLRLSSLKDPSGITAWAARLCVGKNVRHRHRHEGADDRLPNQSIDRPARHQCQATRLRSLTLEGRGRLADHGHGLVDGHLLFGGGRGGERREQDEEEGGDCVGKWGKKVGQSVSRSVGVTAH